MVAAKKKRNRVQGVGYGVGFSSNRGGRMRPLTSEHYGGTTRFRCLKLIYRGSEGRCTKVQRLTVVTWSSGTAKATKGCCNKKSEVRWLRRRRLPMKLSICEDEEPVGGTTIAPVAAGVQSMPSPTSKFAAKDVIVGAEVESQRIWKQLFS